MNIIRKGFMVTAAAVTLGLAAMGSAQADTFASAILDINNFRLLNGAGVAYSATDFATLSGTNDAHATASWNGIFANAADSQPILSGIQPNVPRQCAGPSCPVLGENNFNRFVVPPSPGTFGYADQALSGSVITIGAVPAGAHAQTRADAATAANINVTSGNSDVGTSTTFAFQLGQSDTMTVAFDANPYTAAFVSDDAGATSNANARLSWSINIVDLSTNTSVFSFAPSELNAESNVSRTDADPGLLEYNAAGQVISFTATTPLLTAGTTYQITIQHNTLANALQQEVPEPATLAIVAAGLLSMSLVSRRRKS